MIKVKDFPFDTQCCEVNFYSWAHTARQMKIQQFGSKNVTNTTHLSTNTEVIYIDHKFYFILEKNVSNIFFF